MIIDLGPEKYRTTFDFHIPENIKRLGVMVSGGLDSTILLFLILKELQITNRLNQVEVNCFTAVKNDGATYYAKRIISEINKHFQLNLKHFNNIDNFNNWNGRVNISSMILIKSILGSNTLYIGANNQTDSNVKEFKNSLKTVYKETDWIKAPFINMIKPNMVDLFFKLGAESLIKYTHTCTVNPTGKCNNCYSCEEREWAFNELKVTDNDFIEPDAKDISFNNTWINNE